MRLLPIVLLGSILTGCAAGSGLPGALALVLVLSFFTACSALANLPPFNSRQIDDERFSEALLRSLIKSATTSSSSSSTEATVCTGTQDYTQSFDLSAVDPATVGFGFRIDGEPSDAAGYSVSSAGDFNGDGFDDILVAAPYYNGMQGAAYVIFGRSTGFANIDLTNVHSGSTDGIRITREAWTAGGLYFHDVRSAGDVNGDGFDDILLGGQYGGAMYDGRVYLIFGKAGPSDVDTSSMSLSDGVRFLSDSANWLYTGQAVAGLGDVNGDGIDDMAVTALMTSGYSIDGRVYVIYGRSAWGSVNFNLSNIGDAPPDADGYVIDRETAGDRAGQDLAAAGDLNGDGLQDLFLGAPGGNDGYVVYGTNGTRNNQSLGSLGGDGYKITGSTGDSFGHAVAAGDIDGDGTNDLVISDRTFNAGGGNDGRIAVVYGQSGATSLDSIGSSGFLLTGVAGAYRSGNALAAGDLNGDGFDDLIIGSPQADYSAASAGAVHVVFGSAGATDDVLSSFTDGAVGFRIDGSGSSVRLGQSVGVLNDVNGDGCDDMVIGSSFSGNRAYVIFGGLAQ